MTICLPYELQLIKLLFLRSFSVLPNMAAPIIIITQAMGRCKPLQPIPDSTYKDFLDRCRKAPSW